MSQVSDHAVATDLPANPSDPVLPADPQTTSRDADPCPLIDLVSLRKFGEPQFTTPPNLQSCQAAIKASSGDIISIRVMFKPPDNSLVDVNGRPHQVGDVTIFRKGRFTEDDRPRCRNYLVLAARHTIEVTTLTNGGEPVDLCAVTEVATIAAVAELIRHPGITYTFNRTAAYSFARSDACDMLDDTALRQVPGLDPNIVNRGYAKWTCFWGQEPAAATAELRFLLRGSDLSDLGKPTTPIAGKPTFLNKYGEGCQTFVVHRLVSTVTDAREVFEVAVDAWDTSLSADKACELATALAATVEQRLPKA